MKFSCEIIISLQHVPRIAHLTYTFTLLFLPETPYLPIILPTLSTTRPLMSRKTARFSTETASSFVHSDSLHKVLIIISLLLHGSYTSVCHFKSVKPEFIFF